MIPCKIDPLTTTFQQLKSLTGRTDGKRLPTADALPIRDDGILFSYERQDFTLTVFQDGFCLFQSDSGTVVFAVDRCRSLICTTPNGETVRIDGAALSHGPCLIPLLVKGSATQRYCAEDYECYWQALTDSLPD